MIVLRSKQRNGLSKKEYYPGFNLFFLSIKGMFNRPWVLSNN